MRPSLRLAVARPVIARGLWLAVAGFSSGALAADLTDRSFAGASLDQAARAAERVWQGSQDLGRIALGLIGVEYRYGGETPSADSTAADSFVTFSNR
jgi:hypothetical protein